MKTSEMIKELINDMATYGDRELCVDLLTENQSNLVNITGIYSTKKMLAIDCDINNLKEFKKSLR